MPFKSVLFENSPDSLQDLCIQVIIENRHVISTASPDQSYCGLREGISLPTEICEKLLQAQLEKDRDLDTAFVRNLSDTNCTRLKRISLRLCSLSDKEAETLFKHQLVELELNRMKVAPSVRKILNKYSSQLLSLSVNECLGLLPLRSRAVLNEVLIAAPKLKRLVLRNLNIDSGEEYLPKLLQPLPLLTHLDLSECSDVGDFECIASCLDLRVLILYNVPRLQKCIDHICKLKLLRHLDLSQSDEILGRPNDKHGIYTNPSQALTKIVESLPELQVLDISGTNLAGTGVAEPSSVSDTTGIDIPGLRSRINSPLKFLGLYRTHHEACQRFHIPALRISGDANEDQILAAGEAYIDRTEIMQRVLNDIFHIFRYENFKKLLLALDIILQAMELHLRESHIQISGSASLFYIVKGPDNHRLNVRMKQKMITVLLKAMDMHSDDPTMMRNGCLTLCQFKIPQDVLFSYERLVLILLHVVADSLQDDFVRRIAVFLLNSLACQLDGKYKQLVGDLGAIETMLQLIADRLSRLVCDDVMEVAWSTMWNVTDETAVNCQRFLDHGGMNFFLDCLKAFPENPELLRNMMGLLGNVAEVDYLRPQLMTSQFVGVFSELLFSTGDGIEVSYNAAGVLAHMASDGAAAWTIETPSREEVLRRIVTAVDQWDPEAKRNINYRSFEPILRLLKVQHTPECQYWAAWALANLTRVYPEKYCQLLKSENGVELLEAIIDNPSSSEKIRRFAAAAVKNCNTFRYLENVADQTDDLEG